MKAAGYQKHTGRGGVSRMAAALAVVASLVLTVCLLPLTKAYAAELTESGTDQTPDADGQPTITSEAETTYTVTYHKDGGTITDEGSYTGYTGGIGLPKLPEPTKPGYRFDGWYEHADYSGDMVIGISAAETGDKIYYAKWVEETQDPELSETEATDPEPEGGGTENPDTEPPEAEPEGGGTEDPDTEPPDTEAEGGGTENPDPELPDTEAEGGGTENPDTEPPDTEAEGGGTETVEPGPEEGGLVEDFIPTKPDDDDLEIDVQGFTEDSTIYSVDVEWGAMTFQYADSIWDATGHESREGAGWKVYDSKRNEAKDSEEELINQIQVINHSNTGVCASFTYTPAFGFEETGGTFAKAAGDADTSYDETSGTLTLAAAENGAPGPPTVGTVYFMPDGIKKDGDGKVIGMARWTRLGTITVSIMPP